MVVFGMQGSCASGPLSTQGDHSSPTRLLSVPLGAGEEREDVHSWHPTDMGPHGGYPALAPVGELLLYSIGPSHGVQLSIGLHWS